MKLNVTSETGRLRTVLMHEPGPEVDNMVPSMMEELLFDDILYGDGARREHGILRAVLEKLDVRVLDARDLLEKTLGVAAARDRVLEVMLPHLSNRTEKRMLDADATELTSMLVDGVRVGDGNRGFASHQLFELSPIPNWCFQRDPQVTIGSGMVISAMATPARWRESFLSSVIFAHHPELGGTPRIQDAMQPEAVLPAYFGPIRPSVEGGDVLILSKDVVAVGSSERTNRSGIQQLARHLARMDDGPRWLLAVVLPHRRAFMHLDTVFTPIDTDQCLVYPPIADPDAHEAARVYQIDLRTERLRFEPAGDLLTALADHDCPFTAIPCGGDDPLDQQREQWTDGSNAFAVAPGVIVLYDRNLKTIELLDGRGYRSVAAEALLDGSDSLDIDGGEKACIVLPSHEIARARGGPHCLTQPLQRD